MIEDKSAIKTVLHEIVDAMENLPKPDTRVWYFSMENGLPELLIAGYVGCKFSFDYFDFNLISRKRPAIENYFLRNDQHSPVFKVNKIYPSREQALAEIGGVVYGKLTEIKERPITNSDPNSAA